MKRILSFSLIAFGFSTTISFAQFSYSFTALGGTYTANAAPTTLIAAGTDDALSAATNIGFSFTYGCNTYTQFKASSNGWLTFNTAVTGSNLTNNLNASFDRPIVAPLWDDLAVGAAGTVNYQLTGTAPNRILTVEWKDMEWTYSAASSCISFQVKLYETSNQIDFVYLRIGGGGAGGGVTATAGASIGISGTTSGQFYSLDGTGASPTASTVTETTTLNTRPLDGQVYRWTNSTVMCTGTPTGGTAGASPTTTNCATTTTTLTLTGGTVGCGILYQWQSSPDNIVWTNIAGANGTTYVATNTATTYYRCLVTCTNSGLSQGSASVLVTFTGVAPANDLPCSATPLTLGISGNGDNTCAGSASEPAAPACWVNGSLNTVWYSVVCPASGSLKIKTVPVSSGTPLQNTQIAIYSGTCGPGLTLVACNDNAPACGFYTQYNSELSVTGLTSGATYYIVVDGNMATQGQFEILVINGTSNFPLVPGQDCPLAFPVCNQTSTIGNPGYQVIGGQCDNTGAAISECTSGEANSVWYTINIGAAGSLSFDIVPNDYGNPNPITGQANPGYTGAGTETDYDWVLWKTAGSGATTCANIMSSGGDLSIRCNFSFLGVTGCSPTGNTPAAYGPPAFDGSYETSPAVVAGETYVLAIHNFSNSTAGFTIQFPAGSPVSFTPTSTYYWSGGANTSSWNTSMNWGGCGTPDCSHDAVITNASSFQPILTAGSYTVRDVTINAGASLTLQSGATLNVCGNFTNNGNLVCQAGSTINFMGTGVQLINGSLVNTDGFYHLMISKPSGSVLANVNIDVKGNFTTTNGTSIFNSNNKYIKVAGNFSNFNGNTTYTGTGTTGTLEFNGAAAQTYHQGASQLDLNFVLMNHTSTGVTLLTDMFVKATTGTLTFTNGKINTGAFRVDVANNTPACVTIGTTTSYVNGNLWRTIATGGGAYNFPVGTSTLYERALVSIPGANTYTRLQSRFDPWPGSPNTQGGSECTVTYSLPSENMGYWTINQTGSNTGTYNMTLYANGATNTAGASAWTIEKATSLAGPWILNGSCVVSTATIVYRNGMSGFSVFAVAQAPTPLPVQLTEFTGHPDGEVNILNWTTESEVNNSHFILQKSSDGVNYEDMERVEGAGNSNMMKNYSTVDENPFGTTYYKLRQFDFNGDFSEYGPIVISNTDINEFNVYNVYPNPAHGSFFVEVYSKIEMVADLHIYDSYGRLVYGKPTTINGLNTLEIQTAGWSSGIYTIKIMNETLGFQFIKKVVVEK